VPPWVNADAGTVMPATVTCPGGCSCKVRSRRTGVRAMMLAMLGAGLLLLGRRARRARTLP
jgi:hypothetical protein